MNRFHRTETAPSKLLTYGPTGALADPATSMVITITDPAGTVVVSAAAMNKDTTGTYHYNYTPGVSAVLGWYRVRYIATDSIVVTIEDDGFNLEA